MALPTSKNAMLLSVIICIKITDKRLDIFDKFSYALSDSHLSDNIEFILVDDGSPSMFTEQIKDDCIQHNIRYIATGSDTKDPFNLAKARNKGVLHAKSQLVMFLDVDLVPYPDFYRHLLNECELLELKKQVSRFLMVPVIYLTDYGKDVFFSTPTELRRQKFINAVSSGDKTLIEQYSSGTSVIVVNRYHYLKIGGQDERFKGWGYEDYEFATRLILHAKNMPLPPNWLSMTGNFMTISNFEGWKAVYRLYGDWLGAKGMFLFHIPHHVNQKGKAAFEKKNYDHLIAKMKETYLYGNKFLPLVSHVKYQTLLFRDNPFCNHPALHPFLGTRIIKNESLFTDEDHFIAFLKDKHIDLIVFPNPYATKKLTMLYNLCREKSIKFIIAERGALPNSVYHDKTGFLNDGMSYDKSKWNHSLSSSQVEDIKEYINSVLSSSTSLEKQASPRKKNDIRKFFDLSANQKILLVPMQLEHDTVVQYFSGEIQTFENFCSTIKHLAKNMNPDWSVLVKAHPVDDRSIDLDNCLNVDNWHINDLIMQCDAVATINSSVGLLSMMANKPLYVFGDAFYSHHKLCHQVRSNDDLVNLIRQGYEPNHELIYRFLHYLRFEFYSFGTMETKRQVTAEGKQITATLDIDYYELRNWTEGQLILKETDNIINFDSPLFDRYRNKPLGEINVVSMVKQRRTGSSFFNKRKLLKLRHNPYAFFRDLRFKRLRVLRFLFYRT